MGTERIAAFAVARRVGGYRRWRTVGSLRPMLDYLRRLGLVPAEEPRTPGPVDVVLGRYRRWLGRERRLGEQTVDLRLHWAGKFLIAQIAPTQGAAIICTGAISIVAVFVTGRWVGNRSRNIRSRT